MTDRDAPFIAVSIFDVNSRIVVRNMMVGHILQADLQCGPDEGWVLGTFERHRYRIDADGQPYRAADERQD